jgi:2-polyprenyl-3-methyl-5-hydroxy-6-metoxy-1,4-benzoquinol methylase
MAVSSAPSPELFFETLQAYQRTAALKAGLDLGIFTAVANGARTAPAIARECGASERGTRMLCDMFTMIGFLRKAGNSYELTPEAAVFLVRSSPAYLGGTVEFLASPEIVENFAHLAETVRRGTVGERGNTVAEENPVWQKFARAMAPMAAPSAQAIADILDVAAAGPLRVLDIAAGHGVYGVTIAQRNPRAEIVAADWASVLTVATAHAAKMGVADRHRALPGDAFKVDFGGGFDIALITNFLHHFDAATCTAFLKKVAAALKSGGRVVVLEFVPNPDRVSPPMAASFVMNMLAGTPAGDAYTFDELRGMLTAAGFDGATAHRLGGPQTVGVAGKRS